MRTTGYNITVFGWLMENIHFFRFNIHCVIWRTKINGKKTSAKVTKVQCHYYLYANTPHTESTVVHLFRFLINFNCYGARICGICVCCVWSWSWHQQIHFYRRSLAFLAGLWFRRRDVPCFCFVNLSSVCLIENSWKYQQHRKSLSPKNLNCFAVESV